jgi:uncharacterized membrane protein
MPNPYFIIFEVMIYLLFAVCIHHAKRQGLTNLLRLLAGVVYGLVLELATLRQLSTYTYGHFLIMIQDVPLCIGVAWSCIIYSSMEFSDASSLPYWVRPILDGLLALNIDLALDAIAIRLGFWSWGQGLKFQYFGVPYANFWAWFLVVFSFSLGYRLLAHREAWIVRWISPFLALVIGLIAVLGTNVFVLANPLEDHKLFLALTLCFALIVVITMRPQFDRSSLPALVFWIPFTTHLYVLAAGLISGVIFEPSFLLIVGLVMAIISFSLHHLILPHRLIRGDSPWSDL